MRRRIGIYAITCALLLGVIDVATADRPNRIDRQRLGTITYVRVYSDTAGTVADTAWISVDDAFWDDSPAATVELDIEFWADHVAADSVTVAYQLCAEPFTSASCTATISTVTLGGQTLVAATALNRILPYVRLLITEADFASTSTPYNIYMYYKNSKVP